MRLLAPKPFLLSAVAAMQLTIHKNDNKKRKLGSFSRILDYLN